MAADSIKVGDTVTWREPTTDAERRERFEVLEVDRERCLMAYVCDLPIRPMTRTNVADLKVVAV